MLLVTEGRGKINQLAYNKRTSEYVFYHNGKEIWREKDDDSLLNYFNFLRESYLCIDEREVNKYRVWKKYIESCDRLE